MSGPPTNSDPPTEGAPLTPWEQARLAEKLNRLRARTFPKPAQRGHLRLVASNGVVLDEPWMQQTPEESPETERRRFYALMLQKAADMGYKPGWAAHRFKDKFGTWPPKEFRSKVV